MVDATLFLRHILGPRSSCRFYPSCTIFALEVLERERFLLALQAIIKRVLSCHPLYYRVNRPPEA